MKFISCVLSILFLVAGISSCANKDQRYIDLETGKHVHILKDSTNGYIVNADTRQPVDIYVNNETKDTIYGKTGKIINGHVIKTGDGKYKYVAVETTDDQIKKDDDGSYKIKDGDYKKKVEKDGDVKIKDGDTKIKIDGKTGEKTIKKD